MDILSIAMAPMLSFFAGGTRFALPLTDVVSVVRMVSLSPAGTSRTGMAGTINFHGRIVPVCSLNPYIGLPPHPPRDNDVLVIVRLGEGSAALWADSTAEILDLPVAEAGSAGTTGSPGTYTGPDGTVVIGDPAAFIENTCRTVSGGISPVAAGPGIAGAGEAGEGAPAENPTPAILEERARALARPEHGEDQTVFVDILRFRLLYEEYAFEMRYVREVILTGEFTPVPGTPDYIAGICAIRGEIISLVDLRALFSLSERGLTDLNRVIVITDGKITFGILADHITGVGTIAIDSLSHDTGNFTLDRKFIKGVIEGSLVVIDAAAILADPRMIVDDTEP